MILLTPREYQVMQAVCDGLTNEEGAEELDISVLTFKDHLKNIKEKTGGSGRTSERLVHATYHAGRYVAGEKDKTRKKSK